MKQFLPVSRRCFTWNNFVICSMPLFHMKQKCHPFGWHLSLSIKSVFTPKQQSRGSAHSKAFAAQTHENRGRVPRFSYFKREKVSVWELSDVRVLRSQNTDCRKNDSFSTVSSHPRGWLLRFAFFERAETGRTIKAVYSAPCFAAFLRFR